MPGGNNFPLFINLARKAVAQKPNVPENWALLSHCLAEEGQLDEAIAVLADAVEKFPQEVNLQLTLAELFHRNHQTVRMEDILSRTAAPAHDNKAVWRRHLKLLLKTHSGRNSPEIAADAVRFDPANSDAIAALAKAARRSGNLETIIPICRKALQCEPANPRARYELAVALALTGQTEEARRLIDPERFFRACEPGLPPAYATAEAFRADLVAEISSNPALVPDPAGLATRGGLQTTNSLPRANDRAIGMLLELIRSAVDEYVAKLPASDVDPFIGAVPAAPRLSAWAVVYPGDARQVSHIHPSGWLSGVYYVSAPPPDGGRHGCLVVGSPDAETDASGFSDPPWSVRYFHPGSGQLVLFPSYVPHSTVPTTSSENRICIAFDVIRGEPHGRD